MIINPYRFAAGGGLLDTYTGASAAFSLRELSGAWAGQDVILVQRTGGDQSGFTAAEVADGTLETWVAGGTGGAGTNDGFVLTWYDQSGNGFDATAAASDAPWIAIDDAVRTVNGEPAIDFGGSGLDKYLQNAGNIPYNGGVSWYCVADIATASSTRRIWSDDIAGQQGYTIFRSDGNYFFNDNSGGFKSFAAGNHSTLQELSSVNMDDSDGSYSYARDGSETTGSISSWTGSINTGNTANFGIMAGGDGAQPQDGFMQELIIYPNDQSANRTGIETNINDHYSIY